MNAKKTTLYIAQAAVIAALYFVLERHKTHLFGK